MVGWHHQLNGHEFEQTLRDSEGQGSLVCCNPWGSQTAGHDLATEQQVVICKALDCAQQQSKALYNSGLLFLTSGMCTSGARKLMSTAYNNH